MMTHMWCLFLATSPGGSAFLRSSDLHDTPQSPYRTVRIFCVGGGCGSSSWHSTSAKEQSPCHAATGRAIRSLCETGQLDKALDVLLHMDQQGIVPAEKTYCNLLKACTKRRTLAHAKRVQAHLARHGLETTRFLGEYMVSTLVKCGGLEESLELFRRLPNRTVFSWTALISGYTSAEQGQEALRMYRLMRDEGVEPDEYTFASLLRACGSIGDLEQGCPSGT